jgi:hypothetical protein
MGWNDRIADLAVEAQIVAIQAKAIEACDRGHEDIMISNGDPDANSHAYALGTIRWQRGDMGCDGKSSWMQSRMKLINPQTNALAAKRTEKIDAPWPERREAPADVIGNAVKVMRIATGDETEVLTDDGKNAAAVALGRMGGKARAEGMTAKRRKEIAKKAAAKRWGG